MPALLYAQLAQQTQEALDHLESLPPLARPEEKRARLQIKKAGRLLLAVLQGPHAQEGP